MLEKRWFLDLLGTPPGNRRSQRAWRLVIDSGLSARFPAACPKAKGTKANPKPPVAEAVKLAKADYGIAERARILGGYPYFASVVRGTAGLNAKRNYGPKSGGPERAARLLRALEAFWQRSSLGNGRKLQNAWVRVDAGSPLQRVTPASWSAPERFGRNSWENATRSSADRGFSAASPRVLHLCSRGRVLG